MLHQIRTVLIHNSHPGNIGAVARAIKNMGLQQLFLVAPKNFPSLEADARAKDAIDILQNAVVVNNLEDALVGCQLILGSSARNRTLLWPILTVREAAQQVIQFLAKESFSKKSLSQDFQPDSSLNNSSSNMQSHSNGDNSQNRVAILYGCEQHGLTNVELHHCHSQIIIPANPQYSSLNLAQAAQIISYEIKMAHDELLSNKPHVHTNEGSLATFEELAGLYTHLEETLIVMGHLDKNNPGQLIPRLKRLFGRAKLDKIELNILRGILSSMQKILVPQFKKP